MRLIKMLGLAMVAALAAMAFVGASGASADELCKADPEGYVSEKGTLLKCKTGTVITEALIEGSSGVGILQTGEGEAITCNPNAFEATVAVDAKALTITGTANILSFGKKNGAEGCTSTVSLCSKVVEVKQEGTPALSILLLTNEDGLVVGKSNGHVIITKPKTKVVLNCFLVGNVKCVYGGNAGETVTAQLYNKPQEIAVEAQPVNKVEAESNGLCPKTGKLTVTHKITSSPVYIAG